MTALVDHLLRILGPHRGVHPQVGQQSNWFIDSKQTVCRPEGLLLVADAFLAAAAGRDHRHRRVSRWAPIQWRSGLRGRGDEGPAAARCSACARRSRTTAAGDAIAGVLEPGDRVVITEDTVTRGTSPLEAAAVVRAAGAEPVMVIAVVDRGGTCAARCAAEGMGFAALVTAPDLGFDYEGGG